MGAIGLVNKVMWRVIRYVNTEPSETVRVRIPQPISKEVCVPWKLLPATIAGMKVLAGATPYTGTVIDFLDLSDEDVDNLEKDIGRIEVVSRDNADVIEHDSTFMSEVQKAIDGAKNLACECPYEAVARDLRGISHMTDNDLEMLLVRAMM